jgi:hypothetical protein
MNRLSGNREVEVVSILMKESKSHIDGPLVVKLYKFRKSGGN